jgi:hypothetical protein
VADTACNGRVTSIVKKWKPPSKIERIFSRTAETKLAARKKLSWLEASPQQPPELPPNAAVAGGPEQ